MAGSEQMTVAVPPEVADAIRSAIEEGEFASDGDLVRAVLEEWAFQRTAQGKEFEALRADIAVGMADIEAGRVTDFNVEEIIREGKARRSARSRSA